MAPYLKNGVYESLVQLDCSKIPMKLEFLHIHVSEFVLKTIETIENVTIA